MQRDLGDLGETTFEQLCASVGLVANKSLKDRFGWDYIVEFPYKNQNISIDMSQPIECKVQVKATDHQKRKLAIKVSVLDRLVKSSNPTFIIFLEFDESAEIQSIFLRHRDKEIIEKTLKRSRELSVKNRPLHKSTIQIHYDKYKLSDNKGITLKEAMESYIPHGMAHYIKEKQHLLETLGFDGSFGSMQLTFSNTSLEELMDISLGISDKPLTIESIQNHTQIRFGIELPAQDTFFQKFDIKDAKLTISEVEGKDGLIIFVDEDDEVVKKYKAKIIPAPFSTEEYMKVKIDTDIFYFTMSSKEGVVGISDFNLKFDYFESNPLVLNDILKYYEIHYLISNHPKKIFQKLISNNNVFSLPIEKESLEPEIVNTYKVANRLRKILNKMNIYQDIVLDINDLENNRVIVHAIYDILFSFKSKKEQDLSEYKVTIYQPFILTLNEIIYSGWILLKGVLVAINEHKYRVDIQKTTLIKEQFNIFNLNFEFFNKKVEEFIKLDNSDNIPPLLNLKLIPNIKDN